MRRVTIFIFALLLFGCAGKYQHTLAFQPSDTLRVAVLPFVQRNADGKIMPIEYSLLVDEVPLISEKLDVPPPALVEKLVRARLKQGTKLDLVSSLLIERLLSHNGYSHGVKLDIDRVYSTDAKTLCSLLSCDAVLYGAVTKWDRSYYGIQSVHTVGIDLKLVSADDNAVLFSASGEDSESRGITKGPTGLSSIVLEPIKGLDSEIIVHLASSVVNKTLAPVTVLTAPAELKTPPPAIFASAHDAHGSGLLPKKNHLTVLLLGSIADAASFSIGNVIQDIPMVEKDPGHYIGEFYPLENDSFQKEWITVSLTDEHGRTTKQKIGTGPISVQ